jgi:hypothetical protein
MLVCFLLLYSVHGFCVVWFTYLREDVVKDEGT